jgi:hypothetical protein
MHELFERERIAFDTAVRAELLRLRAGKKQPVLAVLNEPPPPNLLRESSGSLTPALGDAQPRAADDEMVNFRPKWTFWLTVAWFSLGVGLVVAVWLGLRRTDDPKDFRPIAELGAQPPPLLQLEPEPKPIEPAWSTGEVRPPAGPAARSVASVTAPASLKVTAGGAAVPRARAAPASGISAAPPDDSKRPSRVKRSLDQDDPWAE